MKDPISWPAAVAVTGLSGLSLVAAGVAIISISARAADGRRGRSRVAGIRTRATLRSDEAWLAAHRAGERSTRIGGWLTIVSGLVPLVAGAIIAGFDLADAETYMVVWVVLLLIGIAAMLVAVVHGAVVGNRAARAVHDPDPLSG